MAGAIIFGWAVCLLISLPIILAGAIGANLGRTKPFWIKGSDSITFLATRPVSSAGLVFPKFLMAFRSGLVAWLIVIIGMTFWIVVSGNVDNVRSLARVFYTRFTGWRAIAVTAATLVLLPAVTWRQLSDFFPFALTGRRVVVEGCVLAGVMLFIMLAGTAAWLYHHPAALGRFLAIAPYFAAGLALLKASLATGAFYSALRLGLLTWRHVGFVSVLWLSLTAAAMILAGLVLPAGGCPRLHAGPFHRHRSIHAAGAPFPSQSSPRTGIGIGSRACTKPSREHWYSFGSARADSVAERRTTLAASRFERPQRVERSRSCLTGLIAHNGRGVSLDGRDGFRRRIANEGATECAIVQVILRSRLPLGRISQTNHPQRLILLHLIPDRHSGPVDERAAGDRNQKPLEPTAEAHLVPGSQGFKRAKRKDKLEKRGTRGGITNSQLRSRR